MALIQRRPYSPAKNWPLSDAGNLMLELREASYR